MDPSSANIVHLRHEIDVYEYPGSPQEALRLSIFNPRNHGSDKEQDIQLLDEVIDLDLRQLKLLRLFEANYIVKCNELSHEFMDRYSRMKRPADLARAVYFIRLVVAIGVPTSGSWSSPKIEPYYAASASIIIAEAAKQRASEECFDEAVQLARVATTPAAPGVPVDETFLRNVAYVLDKRFDLLGNVNDLEETILISEAVAEKARQTGASDLDEKLFQYGMAICKSWELYRDPRELKKATEAFDDMLQSPSITKEALQIRLLQYANHLFSVYNYQSEVRFLDKIDSLLESASKIPNEGVTSKLSLLLSRGASCSMRAERSYDAESARLAIKFYEEGLKFAPRELKYSNIRNIFLSNLINSSTRFCVYNRPVKNETKEYLDKIEAHLAEDEFPNSSEILLNSAGLLYQWYQQARGDTAALKEAVRRVQKALQLNDMNWSRMGSRMSSRMGILAIPILKDYWSLTQLPEDFDSAYSFTMKIWNSPNESPHIKIQTGRDAAEMLYKAGRLQEAWNFLKQAVEIILLACPRNLPRDDQKYVISTLSGLSNDACAVGIAAGVEITEVLQTLESGRGLAVALAHGASEDFQHLSPELRKLLSDFEDSKSRVYFSNLSSGLTIPQENYQSPKKAEELRTSIQNEFEVLSKKVKEHAELNALLEPPAVEFFQDLASHGPIVVVNSSSFRNNVILITESKISTFQLQDDSPELLARYGYHTTIEEAATQILELITRGDQDQWRGIWSRNITLRGMLTWLWDFVVKRVCEELQLQEIQGMGQNVTRVWWLSTGYFTQMPFHAAGDLKEISLSKLMMNRAISSYISSFRMLKWARSRGLNPADVELDGMIVTMAAPKQKRPPAGTIFVRTANQEADAVEQEASRVTWLRRDKPSVVDVIAEIPKKSFMHFCCHGESDPKEPSQSRLKLFKKVVENNDDPRNVDNLTAGSISTVVTERSVLAVLSACYTTEIRELTHLDEGLQIGNAFQIAGFPHVIGSLWAASDVICPQWSRRFYSTLNSLIGVAPLSNSHIALAYHVAMVESFLEDPEFVILWAPFVHIGA